MKSSERANEKPGAATRSLPRPDASPPVGGNRFLSWCRVILGWITARPREYIRREAARRLNLYTSAPVAEWRQPYFQATVKMQLPPGKSRSVFPNEAAFDPFVREAAERFAVPVTLIKAIIATESSFNPRAYREEPQIGDASRGLMQVLLTTALGLGFTGDPEELFDPRTNIMLGAKLLRQLKIRFGDRDRIIAAYNAGAPHYRKPGVFTNQPYVDRVLGWLRRFDSAEGQGFYLASISWPIVLALALAAFRGLRS